MAKNVHKVPARMWRQWNKDEQAMFNRMWSNLGRQTFEVPGVKLTDKQINVMKWNACWTAAYTMQEWRDYWRFGEKGSVNT